MVSTFDVNPAERPRLVRPLAVVRAAVPAAGEETRHRPRTASRPKALLEAAGEPLLARVVDALDPLGVTEFVVVVGYRGGEMVARFGDAFEGAPSGTSDGRRRRGYPAATLRVSSVPAAEARETGVAVVEDGRVTSVVEKPAEPPSTLATTGVWAFSPAIFDACRRVEPSSRGALKLADVEAAARRLR